MTLKLHVTSLFTSAIRVLILIVMELCNCTYRRIAPWIVECLNTFQPLLGRNTADKDKSGRTHLSSSSFLPQLLLYIYIYLPSSPPPLPLSPPLPLFPLSLYFFPFDTLSWSIRINSPSINTNSGESTLLQLSFKDVQHCYPLRYNNTAAKDTAELQSTHK